MQAARTFPGEVLRKLEQFDTCTVSNAVEQFRVRTRNEGFVNGSVRCMFPDFSPRAGYAVTARVRTSSTPLVGRCYYDRAEWWSYVQTLPAPRFIVLQDVDHISGLGALFGEIHAYIARALDCNAVVTNGAVRDLPGSRQSGLQIFASNVSVSHAYAHIVDFGSPVEIGGLAINPGDLLHGDQHGILSIPLDIAERLPAAAAEIVASERELIEFCKSAEFSFTKLTEKMQRLARKTDLLEKDTK